ncbi:MAG: AMP-binding protein [Candidatus Marinimicrobia bacterium]|nr:AMP-binding protein [Candidatus Neomarinimicrobiota bacterium]
MIYSSPISLPDYPSNLAVMLNEMRDRLPHQAVYQERKTDTYLPVTWTVFHQEICALQAGLQSLSLSKGDRVAILSRNCREMLEIELAVMSMGAISVPIFAGYPCEQANRLIEYCDPKIVVVADQNQFDKIDNPGRYSTIIHFTPIKSDKDTKTISFEHLVSTTNHSEILGLDLAPQTTTLMMYTSGTMGIPKCVQLTHQNILSQQAAMKVLWKLDHHDRFLSFLPWHHSFGGIFEKFAAITSGATLSLEHSYGKNIDLLLDNWDKVRPTVFFSVPRIYQEITSRLAQDSKLEEMIFHSELRFIFTAAAPLPRNISDIFQSHGTPIIEGWGLTETSPCCTITDPKEKRLPGIVGKPIPGVSISLADDGEIRIKGPNVMQGYYKNDKSNEAAFTDDGWFNTGDVGEFTDIGLRLISRKDRIFKLTNAEKVVPTEIENLITKDCSYLSHAYVVGSGKDHPVALLFPNKSLFSNLPKVSQLKSGCVCPRNLQDFSSCLTNCLHLLNGDMDIKFNRVKKAMLIDRELSIENEELTPSMKLAPNVVGKVFKANIEYLYGSDGIISDTVYVLNLE